MKHVIISLLLLGGFISLSTMEAGERDISQNSVCRWCLWCIVSGVRRLFSKEGVRPDGIDILQFIRSI
jgi:hypothetical protein